MEMQGVLEISVEEAEKEYQVYLEAVKTRKEKYVEDLKKVYHSLKNGRKVIDVFAAFKSAGVNDDGEPTLAICKANVKTVYFQKRNVGSGRFFPIEDYWKENGDVVIFPSNTWPDWAREKQKNSDGSFSTTNWINREKIKTNVPIVPAHLLPAGKLDNYFLLWEVKQWSEIVLPKRDPYLLRRISSNLFSVLAEWELTDIELAVINGQ